MIVHQAPASIDEQMSIRTERLARLVQREVAGLLNSTFHEESQSMLTVTNVRVTRDLSTAYINISCLSNQSEQRKIALRRIEALAPQIRAALGNRIRHQVRIIPQLRFFLDESLEHADHIERLFEQIRAEQNDRGEDQTPPTMPDVGSTT
jgi:ribosome-binding factor A